jgi:lipoprotein-anchoring transpeptidase ErfK/SrfK
LSGTSAITYTISDAISGTALLTHAAGVHNAGTLTVHWNGRLGHTRLAPAGSYVMTIAAIDRAGNRTVVRTQPFTLSNKRILVSISKEKLWAYEGNKLVLQTLVTNGGPDTPTIPGIFHVQEKLLNWVMHSPWPKGSPLWYPDSPTNYDLLYNAEGGYFIHDAPWRSVFGPGSNSVLGTPGGSYTGTHGCTNVPIDVMARLYNWADTGTLIQIVE